MKQTGLGIDNRNGQWSKEFGIRKGQEFLKLSPTIMTEGMTVVKRTGVRKWKWVREGEIMILEGTATCNRNGHWKIHPYETVSATSEKSI